MRYLIALAFFFSLSTSLFAQSESGFIRKGNKSYNKSAYNEAELSYRKALGVNPQSPRGEFNLGASLYSQEKYPEALEHYQRVIENPNSPDSTLQHAYYNAGNALFSQEKYAESVAAYKSALRLNPQDRLARYNLSEALRRLQQQQQDNQQGNNQNDKQDGEGQQDQSQQQDGEGQQDQNQQQEQQSNEGEQQQEQSGQEQQQKTGTMSQEDAAQLLKALEKQEGDTQEKVQRARLQKQGKRKRPERDW